VKCHAAREDHRGDLRQVLALDTLGRVLGGRVRDLAPEHRRRVVKPKYETATTTTASAIAISGRATIRPTAPFQKPLIARFQPYSSGAADAAPSGRSGCSVRRGKGGLGAASPERLEPVVEQIGQCTGLRPGRAHAGSDVSFERAAA
jgi:hypothetical protein